MRMQAYLEAIGVWNSVVTGYTAPKKNNSMAMEAILEGLKDIQKKKIGKCNSDKELWLRLEQLYSNKE